MKISHIEILQEIDDAFQKYYQSGGDLSDIGNAIGHVIKNYITISPIGWEYDDFINGFNHGIGEENLPYSDA